MYIDAPPYWRAASSTPQAFAWGAQRLCYYLLINICFLHLCLVTSTLSVTLLSDAKWQWRRRKCYKMCCHQLFGLSELKSLVKEAGSHCCSIVTSCPARTHRLSQLMGHTHPVIRCTYSSQCIVNYVLCHVCLAWHIVTNCGFTPQRHLKRPAGGKRCIGRVPLQDSITPIIVDILGISARVPQLWCSSRS